MSDALLTGVIQSLWLGGAAALAMVLLGRVVPGISAAWRHRGWFLVLVLCAVLPFSALVPSAPEVVVRSRTVAVAPTGTAPGNNLSADFADYADGVRMMPPGSTSFQSVKSAQSAVASVDTTVLPLLAAMWIGGALVGLVFLTGQVARLYRLKRRAVRSDEWLQRLWQEARPCHTRSSRLLTSTELALPAACGYLRPAVILPEAIASRLDSEQARYLLLHEDAHLNRYDDWLLLAERVLQLVCWWHPVAWIARRQLETTRELACDAAVADRANRKAYARTLLDLAEMALPGTQGMAPGALQGVLSHRIEALLRPPHVSFRTALPAAGVLAVLGLGVSWYEPPRIQSRKIITDTSIALHQHAGFARGPSALALDKLFKGYEAQGFSGSVLVARGDAVVLDKGYGFADREARIKASRHTRYSTAGMTKMLTASAILVLQQEGKLSVTDTLGAWFEALPEDMARVTIHQLLTHSDGLTRLSAPVYRDDPDDFIDAVAATTRAFPAGTGYRYNDFGHSILGVIIERVSGTSYEEFIKRRFLQPAGMTHTSFEPDEDTTAVEYSGPAEQLTAIAPRAYVWGRRGSLGMVSTAEDLFRWARAMHDPRVVPVAVQRQMLTTYGQADWGAEVGYGWDRMRMKSGAVLWRRVAGTPGMEGEVLWDPVEDWTAVILVNTRLGWRFKVWREIERVSTDGTN